MNKKFEICGLFIVFFVFFATNAYGPNENDFSAVIMQKKDEAQAQETQVVAPEENKPKTKKELAKIAVKNGLFAVISEHYKIDQELLLIPRVLFAFLLSKVLLGDNKNIGHSYALKTFIAINLLASGVNGLIISTGTALIAIPFDRCIMFFTEKSGFFSKVLNSLLLKHDKYFKDNGSGQFKYFLEFFKNKNSYSLKYFLLKFARGAIYTGQFVAQSIVGSLLGQYCTFK